jgi:hypothetical protein
MSDPKRVYDRTLTDEPSCPKLKTDIQLAKRATPRSDTELPRWRKSTTDSEDDSRAQPSTETPEPNRVKFLTLIAEPRVK